MSHALMRRRAEEDRLQANLAVVTDKQRAMDIANFEHRTTAKIAQRVRKEQVSAAREAMAQDLQRRRARLAELLSEEDTLYERMLVETFETPAQRKTRLFARAKELRAAREERRLAHVRKVEQARWREMSDDLRTLDARAVERAAAIERLKQLDETVEKQRQKALEEEKAAQEWETLRQAKIAREEREKREQDARNEEMRLALNQQVQVHNDIMARDRAAEASDARKMIAQWDAEKRAEQARLEAKKQHEIEEADRVKEANTVFAARRRTEAAKEAEEDRRRLQETLEREAAAALKEQEEAEERRQESIRYRKHLEAQLAIEKEEANELDHMYAEEQERAWAKRQAQWDREALARKRLMEEVDRSRKEQIALKQALEKAERERDHEAYIRIEGEIQEAEAEDARRLAESRQAALEHQEDLLSQMSIKERQAARMKQEEYLEYKLMQRAEAQYQARLAKMKAEGMPAKNFKREKVAWYN